MTVRGGEGGEFLFKDGRKFLAYLTVDEWSYKRKSGVSIHLKGSKIASFDQAIIFSLFPLQNYRSPDVETY